MELKKAIRQRKSIRGFLPKPVSKKTIETLLTLAGRAPSWGNTQPWEILVLSGALVKTLGEEFCQMAGQEIPPSPDFEMPVTFPEPYLTRYRQVGKDLFSTLGIAREDPTKRLAHSFNNFRGFGAPTFVYVLLDKALGPYALLDAGLFIQTLCLAAVDLGLGTCILAALARYPDLVRSHVSGIEGKKILIGLALGYPDQKGLTNRYRSRREPLADLTTWA